MNTRLLRKIASAIMEKPRQFDMNAFHKNKVLGSVSVLCDLPKEMQASCGTTHYIAGWAQILSSKRNCRNESFFDAQKLLDIDRQSAARLFYCDEWPDQFKGKKDVWNPTRKQAVARIEHFISTKGSE